MCASTRLCRVSVLVSTTALLLPLTAGAQLAPVMGAHYAARSSDTGFAGSVTSQGGYAASVALDLSPARAGLPVPVSVVYTGGRALGAAGLGWDVPLSYIYRSRTIAHRRPKPGPFSVEAPPPLDPPEFLTLSLMGGAVDLVRNPANTAWVGRNGTEQLEVRRLREDSMVAYDGNGLAYFFSSQGGCADCRLADGNLFLLVSIAGPGGNRVGLVYSFGTPALPGGGTGLAIDLVRLRYNTHPTSPCFKDEIALGYDLTSPTPLSMMTLGRTVLARVAALTTIDVARAPNGSAPGACAAAQSLRKYTFDYQSDPDTGQPRLQAVTMVGRSGTPERTVTLPVAAYRYGHLTASDGTIAFRKTQSITLPRISPPVITFGLSYTSAFPSGAGPAELRLLGPQRFMDLDGNGRPDLQTELGIFRNVPGPDGTTAFTLPVPAGLEGALEETRTTNFATRTGNHLGSGNGPLLNLVEVRKQYVDMNGDGRLDFVDAQKDLNKWTVHLNVPDPADPSRTVDVVRTISTTPLRDAVNHLAVVNHIRLRVAPDKPLPLARTMSVEDTTLDACWKWTASGWDLTFSSECPGFPPAGPLRPEKTITEWELKDINGDGYPDFVYNEGFIRINVWDPPSAPGTVIGETQITRSPVDLYLSKRVMALINTMGVHMANGDENAFASPIVLVDGVRDGCGVARWQAGPGATSAAVLSQTCDFEDVNGDGLADRVTSAYDAASGQYVSTAALGTGDPAQPIAAGATLTLPGPLALNVTDLVAHQDGTHTPRACDTGNSYDVDRAAGLRDINGDGLPDYVRRQGEAWTIHLGSGVDFGPGVTAIAPVRMELSRERNTCTNTDVIQSGEGTTRTPAGLYDLDGDGQAEMVELNFATLRIDVYQLQPPEVPGWVGHTSPAAPAVGRLVAVENGHGAVTRIDYRSAKEDGRTRHHVPYPEIVVAVETVADANGRLLEALTTHAYGDAELIFDSAADRFVFPGYRRLVSLAASPDGSIVDGDGVATITDAYPLPPFLSTMDGPARFERYRVTGRVRDVTTLTGFFHDDAQALLTVDINRDGRRTEGVHYEWDARLLAAGPAPAANEQCLDMAYPYDFSRSERERLSPTDDTCTTHGFTFRSAALSYRGRPGSADPFQSTETVQIRSTVDGVDDLGRTTRGRQENDRLRPDDDLCVQMTYATPTTARPRVLNAPATRTVTDCATPAQTLAAERWEYDGLAPTPSDPTVRASNGFVTAHVVSRIDLDTHASLGDIREFDATYDAQGNPETLTMARDDGARQRIATTYDAFGLVPLTVTAEAVNADGTRPAPLRTSLELDTVTLATTLATDANGLALGRKYDGFERVTQTSAAPATGPSGVLSTTRYLGFAVGASGGRSIVQKVFPDPVAPSDVETAPGRVATTFFDGLGRETHAEVDLGADYANQKMIVGQRTYDLLGRVHFLADPFPSTESFATAYGTTHYFYADGTPQCVVRGQGIQPTTSRTDEAHETYPTCFGHAFGDNMEFLWGRDPASVLAGSPQETVFNAVTRTAIGRVIEQSRGAGEFGVAIERDSRSYDALGHLASLTRYREPEARTGPVTTRWHYDSLGRMNRLEEPGLAPQARTFDSWGQLVQVQWCEDLSAPPCPTGDRRSVTRYDGFGRVSHREDRLGPQTIPESVHDFAYDAGISNAVPPVAATNVIGRLAKATSPTSTVSFSYDGFGRVNAAVYVDRTQATDNTYVEKHDVHADGLERALHLLLPDNTFRDERVDYAYDSARRPRSVKYVDGSLSKDLFAAPGGADIDVFGRIRRASYGLAAYTADHAANGRRLVSAVRVASPAPLSSSREIAFPRLATVPAFDPIGRERYRRETRDGVAEPELVSRYDALDRLAVWGRWDGTGGETPLRSFEFDRLGNVLSQVDAGPGHAGSVTATYDATDLERICSIAYGAAAPPSVCNTRYDGAGNTIEQPARAGGLRTLSYFPSGRVKTAALGGSQATFDYDAFGDVQRLLVTSTSSPDTRRDKRFGSLISRRDELVGGSRRSVVTRSIPGPGGLLATRHGSGPADPWTFSFGERRGVRFVTDETGAFVQDLDYQPFGEAASRGAVPGSQKYTSAQWNGGDALLALGLVQLGARLYDPVVGRFLSRDPLMSLANPHPYAFAANDPVNNADPSGMCIEGVDCNHGPICIGILCFGGIGGWGSGGNSGGVGPGGGSPPPAPVEPQTSTTNARGVRAQALVQTPRTREGQALRRIMSDRFADRDWDALAALKLEDYDDLINAISQQQGTWTDPHDPWNVGVDSVEGMLQLGLAAIPLERVAATLGRLGRGAASRVAGLGGRATRGLFRSVGPDALLATRSACRSGMCSGPVCFVAGTAVATPQGDVPIENIHLGERVEAGNPRCAAEHLPEDTVTIALEVTDPRWPDETARVELARPLRWLAENGLHDGEEWIELEESGIAGRARVTGVAPGPREQPGEGCLVLMTVNHTAPEVLALRLETGTRLELTPRHRLFAEGTGWVPAGALRPGQRLRTDRGPVRLDTVEPSAPNQRVYNLEVGLEHTYRVSADRVLTHNQSCRDVIVDVIASSSRTDVAAVRLRSYAQTIEGDLAFFSDVESMLLNPTWVANNPATAGVLRNTLAQFEVRAGRLKPWDMASRAAQERYTNFLNAQRAAGER